MDDMVNEQVKFIVISEDEHKQDEHFGSKGQYHEFENSSLFQYPRYPVWDIGSKFSRIFNEKYPHFEAKVTLFFTFSLKLKSY